MIESATAFHNQRTEDQGFTTWGKTVRETKARMTYHNDRTAGPIPSFGTMVHGNVAMTNAYSASSHNEAPAIAYEDTGKESDDGFDVSDIVDIINPLQHLPVIGTLYRKFTGDAIGPLASIVGGAIFGGPVGAASGVANVLIKEGTGRDVGENIMALAGFGSDKPQKPKPDLTFDKPLAAQDSESALPGTTLAVANLSLTRSGQKNFAAAKPQVQIWNS